MAAQYVNNSKQKLHLSGEVSKGPQKSQECEVEAEIVKESIPEIVDKGVKGVGSDGVSDVKSEEEREEKC